MWYIQCKLTPEMHMGAGYTCKLTNWHILQKCSYKVCGKDHVCKYEILWHRYITVKP